MHIKGVVMTIERSSIKSIYLVDLQRAYNNHGALKQMQSGFVPIFPLHDKLPRGRVLQRLARLDNSKALNTGLIGRVESVRFIPSGAIKDLNPLGRNLI